MQAAAFIFIAGPCVIEDEGLAIEIAGRLRGMTEGLPVRFVFKASYDKANRTSEGAYRGPGLEEGLRILAETRRQAGVAVLSDVHDVAQAAAAGPVLDIVQVPAFLCRQTDLLRAAAASGKIVNVKKGQFVAPGDLRYAVEKLAAANARGIWLTERGTCFGYNDLVVDFRAFTELRALGHPVIFDATHAVQIPSRGGASSGRRDLVAPLARAAAAYGVDGLFTEVHPDPDRALCDGPNSIRLDDVPELLDRVLAVREAAGEGGA